jgi:hypothetical protein
MGIFRKDDGGDAVGTKQSLYTDFLRSEGYVPEIDKDGDIAFKLEGGSYIIFANEDDPEYYSILFPNFWPIENEAERARAYVAASQASAGTKCAKVFVLKDNVSAAVELLFGEPEQFKEVFRRSIATVRTAAKTFAERMQETA